MALDELRRYLTSSSLERVVLTFDEIEALEARPLPPSARKHAAFWANSSGYSPAWRNAGYSCTRRGVPSNSIGFVRSTPANSARAVESRPGPSKSPTPGASIVLVGCVKTKLDRPAPAQDLYVSPLFRKRRAYAERAARPWYILSALHGLVHPTILIQPYDVYLAGESLEYRKAWGEWVAVQLVRAQGDLADQTIEVHAGQAYVDACWEPLERRGASLAAPLVGLTVGEQLAWYGDDADPTVSQPDVAEAPAGAPADGSALSQALQVLGDQAAAVRPSELAQRPLNSPGLYSWWVDEAGAAEMSAGLGHEVQGLIYAGQTGADSARRQISRQSTLQSRLLRNHLKGRISSSTFRLTLAAALRERLAPQGLFDRDAEKRLDDWMNAHLSVVPLPIDNRAGLLALEEAVVQRLDPPLNLQGVPRTPLRDALSRRRRLI